MHRISNSNNILAKPMQSERMSVRNNMQVFEGEFVSNFILGCIKQTCYVMLKKGTIYIYDSKRSCLNNPQKPRLFFNLNLTKISRDSHFLTLADPFSNMKLWSLKEEDVSTLEESANYNRNNLDPQKIFPKKFAELSSRIDQKIEDEKV